MPGIDSWITCKFVTIRLL